MKRTRTSLNVVLVSIFSLLTLGSQSMASTSVIEWDPPTLNTDGTAITNLTGYIVYYGETSGSYGDGIDVGNVATCTLTGLDDGKTYYATVKAYNGYGMQSENAGELAWLAPDETPPSIAAPGQVSVTAGENDQAQIPNIVAQATITDNISSPVNISVSQDPAAGTLVGLGTTPVTLTATDEAGNTAEAIVNVLVLAMNRPPDVNAGSDQAIRLPTARISLDGTVTDDGLPEDSTVTVEWSLVSGPAVVEFTDAHALNTTATFTEAGSYVLRLTATDGEATATDEVTITVNPKPVPRPPTNLRAMVK